MKIAIPEFALVIVIGTSGSGKSTFCRQHFLPTQVLSSDTYRGFVADDEDSQTATKDAFEALHYMLGKRLQLGRLTVVDATNVQKEARASLLRIAEKWHALKVAIVLDTPESVCHERNSGRSNRQFGSHVVRNQRNDLRRSLPRLREEGFHKVYVLQPEQLEDSEVVLERIWSRRLDEHGPFDIIGDVHGCLAELKELLDQLGWKLEPNIHHPEGRRLIFVGDLVDRGPDSVGVLRLAMRAVSEANTICVPGNHDSKLQRALIGKKVSTGHGLAETLQQLEAETPEFRREVAEFIDGLVSHALLDDGKLCVAHAGLREEMQGRGSKAVREFALYGETTGEIDEFGLPVRYEWAREYRGQAMVVFGHTPVPNPEWLNNTIDIDTGCCFGGKLTALRYPERELVSVQSHAQYAEPARPLTAPVSQPETSDDDLLEIRDVTGRRYIETRMNGVVGIFEENAIAALEIISRFAADPRWLIYLPPTMSPCATSDKESYLEYPTEAFSYYRNSGVTTVICEEKHMGSRAVAVICKSPDVAAKRFQVTTGEQGVLTSRTGRRFFDDLLLEQALVKRLVDASEKAGLFDELNSDWMLIDLELMPWSAKAIGLLKDQYGPVGAAAAASAQVWQQVADAVAARGIEGSNEFVQKAASREFSASRFRDAYRRYCWDVTSLDDYKLAPFHLLASEGAVHHDKQHTWHMETLGRLAAHETIVKATPHRLVNLESESEVADACRWWEDLVSAGGEGMVVKPIDFIAVHKGRTVQPAVKCRGPEYLRIIYGPDFMNPENLTRLRSRGLTRKRSLASNEFALGIEAMERFIRREPLRRVHECVFGVLALESEPVDPRL